MTQPVAVPEDRMDLGAQFAAMGNIFIDPAGAARDIGKKLSWLVPFLVMSLASIVLSVLITPISMRVFRQYPPEGMNPDAVATAVTFMQRMQYASVVTSPLLIFIITSMLAGLIMAASAILDIRARFWHVFALLCYAGLIPLLQGIAGFVVVKAKEADIQSMQELRPRFGLDLVFHEGSKFVTGLLGYFTIFNIWYIVVLGLGFAALAKTTKGKAFSATAPAWIAGMLMTVGGALLQR